MGYLVGTKCYAVMQEANDAYFGSFPVHVQANGQGYFAEVRYEPYSLSPTGWSRNVRNYDLSGTQMSGAGTVAEATTYPECDVSESFFDGMTIGWGLASAMILASCIAFVRKQR